MGSHQSDEGSVLPAPVSGAASVGRHGKSEASKCPCCGRHSVRPTAQPGRTYWYRNTALTLPADLQVPTCRRCKHVLLSVEAMPELAAALERTYRSELIRRAGTEITRLSQACSQRRIEVILALLGEEPMRLEELKRYWALPVVTQGRVGVGRACV